MTLNFSFSSRFTSDRKKLKRGHNVVWFATKHYFFCSVMPGINARKRFQGENLRVQGEKQLKVLKKITQCLRFYLLGLLRKLKKVTGSLTFKSMVPLLVFLLLRLTVLLRLVTPPSWREKECVPFRTFLFHLYFLCLVVVVTAQLLCTKSFLSRLSFTKLQSLTLACPHT